MNFSKNNWWVTPLLFIVSSPIWLAGGRYFLTPPGGLHIPADAARSQSTAFAMDNILFLQHRSGKLAAEIQSDHVFSSDSDTYIDLENISAFITEQGSSRFMVSSMEARYEIVQKILLLMSDVKIITPDGYTLESDTLRYLEKYGKIKTGAAVVFRGPGVTISGGGLLYDMKTGDFRIGGNGRVICDFSPRKKAAS